MEAGEVRQNGKLNYEVGDVVKLKSSHPVRLQEEWEISVWARIV